ARPELAAAHDVRVIASLLTPKSAPRLQHEAVTGLAKIGDRQSYQYLFAYWNGYSPTIRSKVVDVLLNKPLWTKTLLEKIQTGSIPAAHINLTQRQRLLKHDDPAVRELAETALAGTIDADRQRVIQQHQDVLSLDAETARGKAVFELRCAACHRLDGVGHQVGSDLATLTNPTRSSLLVAILDPNRAVEDRFLQYDIETTDGRILLGVIKDESSNSLVITSPDGKNHTVLRSEIEQLRASTQSLMPEGLEKLMSRQDLADVMAFIAESSPESGSTRLE
ncbi:MAG: c-type cytochrome, partial [Planctomycetales bacterium]